jgi:hypothetical protein
LKSNDLLISFSKELLEDFIAKKESIPLRKMKPKNNMVNERFENILKRKVIGEYTSNYQRKRNKK